MMVRLQSTRVWLGGAGLVALLIVAIGWSVIIGPRLSSAGDLRDEAATTRQGNEQLRANLRSLEAKSTRLPQYTSSLRTALAALPYDSGLPAFTRQLNTQARAHGVTVNSVVVGGLSPVTSEPASSGGGTDASPSPAPGATHEVKAFSMQVTVQSTGSLRRQLAFMKDVQAGPRRALVTATQVTPGPGITVSSVDGLASVTTQLDIFSAPQTPDRIRLLQKLLRGDLGE